MGFGPKDVTWTFRGPFLGSARETKGVFYGLVDRVLGRLAQ
jgi:hypothetical protein